MNTFADGNSGVASPVNFNTWRAQTSVFQDVTAYDFGDPGFNLTGSAASPLPSDALDLRSTP